MGPGPVTRIARRALLLLAGLAVLAGAAPALAVDPLVWPELQARLPGPELTPAYAPAAEVAADDPFALADWVLPAGDARRDAVAAELAAAGFRGAALRDQAPADPAAPQDHLRVAVAAFASAAAAQARVGTVVQAVRGAPGAQPAFLQELENVPGGRVVAVIDPATGTARTVVVGATGPYLVVLEVRVPAPVPASEAGMVEALEGVVAGAPGPPDAGAASPLGVSPSLRAGVRAAFRLLRPADPAARTGPLPGTVQAALYQGEVWAVADFGSTGTGDPQLFRGGTDGVAIGMGPVRMTGRCPGLPRALRLAWGLEERCPAGSPDVPLPTAPGAAPGVLPEPARGVGHWVWELERSAPSVSALADRALARGIRTLYVKSGDGVNYWSQFDRAVGPLKARGLRVCGWQYVYGRRPEAEAAVAARAVRAGADCFVVDAEGEFERGRWAQARRYMQALRSAVGTAYPVGLTSFAYVDLHRAFPYSAFLAPPFGAQFTMPQVYWKAFGVPVQRAMDRTLMWNRIYGVAIAPIGGTYLGEAPSDILRFRCAAQAGGAEGVSYWSWQHTRANQWPVLGSALVCTNQRATATGSRYPPIGTGSRGDPVTWLQMRLRAWGRPVAVDGRLAGATMSAVQAFRRGQGIPASPRLDDRTWAALIANPA